MQWLESLFVLFRDGHNIEVLNRPNWQIEALILMQMEANAVQQEMQERVNKIKDRGFK